MKIMIDINHPAHVHYFRNFIKIMMGRGHSFLVVARDKEMAHYLLDYYNINYFPRGKGKDSLFGKILYMPYADQCILHHSIKFKPDLFLSFGSPYAAQVSKLLNKPHIAFDDTENATLSRLLSKPFTDVILNPSSFKKTFNYKHIKFDGFMELCYLHPTYFKPDLSIINQLGIGPNTRYCIIRFVKWKAAHDIGHIGITPDNKEKIINEFSKHVKVFISSESELPPKLRPYHLKIPYEKIHDVLYSSSLLFGESATMASEAAVLGTPAIYIDNVGRGYTDEEQEKYKLVFNFKENILDQENAIRKGLDILQSPNYDYQVNRSKLLNDKIDVTSFMVWFVENYPKSKEIMRKNPDFQNTFK